MRSRTNLGRLRLRVKFPAALDPAPSKIYRLRIRTSETLPILMGEYENPLDTPGSFCIRVNNALIKQCNASFISRLLILLNFTSLSKAELPALDGSGCEQNAPAAPAPASAPAPAKCTG